MEVIYVNQSRLDEFSSHLVVYRVATVDNKIDVELTSKMPLVFSTLELWEKVSKLLIPHGMHESVKDDLNKFEMVWDLQTDYLKNRELIFDDMGRVKQEQFSDNPERECKVFY